MAIIIGIESSCDDTAAAIICDGVICSNVVAGQLVHEQYGGVVPELASRAHQQNIIPVVHEALRKANIAKEDLSAIAFTRGPGLLGSLLVGTSFAKGFSTALDIPLIDVNHLQAHVLAHFIKESADDDSQPKFPFLCLLVSGGNSQIILVESFNKMEIIGQTIDILMDKLRLAAKDYNINEIAVAGGVSANSGLRDSFVVHAAEYGWTIHIPKFEYTTDNAAMVAITGYYKFLENDFCDKSVVPYARASI